MMINKNSGVNSEVNKANTICIRLALSGNSQRKLYIISSILALITRISNIDFPLIINIQYNKAYNSITILYY